MFRNPLIDAAVVLLVLLLFFGPKRLPALGKSLGEGLREFKDSITGQSDDEDEEKPGLTEAASGVPTPAGAPESEAAPVASSEHGPIHRAG